jgi:hypothetical protein
VTIPFLPLKGTYSAYFGVLPAGYDKRSNPSLALRSTAEHSRATFTRQYFRLWQTR